MRGFDRDRCETDGFERVRYRRVDGDWIFVGQDDRSGVSIWTFIGGIVEGVMEIEN